MLFRSSIHITAFSLCLCSVQVAFLPHRLAWSAILMEWAPGVVVVAFVVVFVVIVPRGPRDYKPTILDWSCGCSQGS